jgi:hypothetical protein
VSRRTGAIKDILYLRMVQGEAVLVGVWVGQGEAVLVGVWVLLSSNFIRR